MHNPNEKTNINSYIHYIEEETNELYMEVELEKIFKFMNEDKKMSEKMARNCPKKYGDIFLFCCNSFWNMHVYTNDF